MEDRVVVGVGHRRRVEAAPSDGVAGGLARRRSVIAKVSPITDQWMDGHRIDDRRPRQGRRAEGQRTDRRGGESTDRKSTRLNSSHRCISYAVFCLKKKK